jgi:hypothetical protein
VTEPHELGCPRCGAAREPDQEFCLECGLKLPPTTGTLARVRRSWVKRIGWYPGDWVWTTLLALVVAAAGAAVAIVSTHDAQSSNTGTTFVLTNGSVPLTTPTVAPPATVDTSTLPQAPEPTATTTTKKPKPPATAAAGRTPWPVGHTGWTVVLESLPATSGGRKTAEGRADRAARGGLPDVGILVSSRYATLHPGYFVIFSGIYDSRSQAESTLRAAAGAGFSAAYVRQISQ